MSLTATLITRNPVPLELVERVPTPRPTRSWRPIPHHRLLAGVRDALVRGGLTVEKEQHGLAKDGARYFGLLTMRGEGDYRIAVGLRNSHDKSFPSAGAMGAKVLVCENLSMWGDVSFGRKHTAHIERDLPGIIDRTIGRLIEMRGEQDRRFDAYKAHEMGDRQAHDVIIQALDARVIGATYIPDVIKEWREPRHPEFAGRTGWSLFNSFTEVLKGANLFELPKRTQALHGIMDLAVGLRN